MAVILGRKPGGGGGGAPSGPAGGALEGTYPNPTLAAPLIFSTSAAPADGDLAAGDIALWYDDDDATPTLNIKAKTADGTLATEVIPITPS